jgi:hypothetical protein
MRSLLPVESMDEVRALIPRPFLILWIPFKTLNRREECPGLRWIFMFRWDGPVIMNLWHNYCFSIGMFWS